MSNSLSRYYLARSLETSLCFFCIYYILYTILCQYRHVDNNLLYYISMKITKKQEKEFIVWINKRFDYYRDIMNLNNWQLNISNKIIEAEAGEYLSTTFVDGGYTNVFIDIYDKAYKFYSEKNYQKLNRGIIHELSHILIRDLQIEASSRFTTKHSVEEATERLCDNLSVIIDRLEQ